MLDLSSIFGSSYHHRATKGWKSPEKFIPVLFPSMTISDDGDKYFETLWNSIDGAKDHIWVTMYHFDQTNVGNVTLNKLINAQRRGRLS